MSCGCNNNGNGWGGCGCSTVQYAPPACNPNFPTACTALGSGTIQRVVGEDSAYCKYTVPALAYNNVPASGILAFNGTTGLVNWRDASSANPVYLSATPASQTSGNLLGISTASGNAGQLVEIYPASTSEATFPLIPSGGSTVNWGTIENLVPNTGLVFRNNTGTVAQLSSSAGNIVTFDANGNPIAASASSIAGATAVPSGAILPFAYNVTTGTVPTGWLLCDGTVYQVSAYPTLGALLANTYGGSSGTFAVPNLSGLFIRGSGTQTLPNTVTYSSGSIGSFSLGGGQYDAFQGHYHSNSSSVNAVALRASGGGTPTGSGADFLYSGSVSVAIGEPTQDTLSGNGTPRYQTETRPVSLAMVYCIKT